MPLVFNFACVHALDFRLDYAIATSSSAMDLIITFL